MAGSSMAMSRLILRQDEVVPLLKTLDQAISWAIETALFHKKAPAYMWIMNAKINTRGMITAITH